MNCLSSAKARGWICAPIAVLIHSLALSAAEEQGSPPRPASPGVYVRAAQAAQASAASRPSLGPLFAPPVLPLADEAAAPGSGAPSGPINAGTAGRADELWLVSTRRLPKAGESGTLPEFAPDVYRFAGDRGWTASSLAELVRTENPAAVTGIFVHGNDTSAAEALDDGEKLHSQLRNHATADAPPSRFVIWSWPIVKTNVRVRQSAQANAVRANIEGYFLAAFLTELAPPSPKTVVGYSSGAGVVTGALHVLGGGTLEGRTLPAAMVQKPRAIEAVLLGAAMPNDWLMSGMPHERALSQVDRMIVTVNPSDAVLRWYAMLWGRGGAPALGSTGVSDAARLGAEQGKVVQVSLEGAMQRHHGWTYYEGSPEVTSLLCQEMLHASTVPARQATAAMRRLR